MKLTEDNLAEFIEATEARLLLDTGFSRSESMIGRTYEYQITIGGNNPIIEFKKVKVILHHDGRTVAIFLRGTELANGDMGDDNRRRIERCLDRMEIQTQRYFTELALKLIHNSS